MGVVTPGPGLVVMFLVAILGTGTIVGLVLWRTKRKNKVKTIKQE